MDWMFTQGVWSHIQNTQLRQDLQVELRDSLIIKLSGQMSERDRVEGTAAKAAKAVFLLEYFNAYLMASRKRMQEDGYSDANTERLLALEQIQNKCQIEDSVMNDIVPRLFSNEKLNSEWVVGSY